MPDKQKHVDPSALAGSQLKRVLSVLVADDEPDSVKTVMALLNIEGYVVYGVYRGDHVLDAVRGYKPDVCLLDLEMPGSSGFEVAAYLAQMPLERRPFLIAMSGKYTRKSEELLAESVGFQKFFRKSDDPNALLHFLSELATTGNARP